MKKTEKSRTKTAADKKGAQPVKSNRKTTNADTQRAGRQRSGSNNPQQGSH